MPWPSTKAVMSSLRPVRSSRAVDILEARAIRAFLPRKITKRPLSGEFNEAMPPPAVTGKVNAALMDELSLEDRINDEVRVILEAYSDEMRRTGANYQEMFRKVKSELVRKYKAVL